MANLKAYPRVDKDNPRAMGLCDIGQHPVFHDELKREMAWRGDKLVWTGFLVCDKHLDTPNPQDRFYRLKADPVPVRNPRLDQ